MKTSKIIFSVVFIAGVLLSMTSNAQTRVTINAGIVAPYGYPPVYYAPQPVYPPGYYAPGVYYGPYGHPHHAYYNHNPYGYGYRRGQGYRNHPHHY